MTFWYPGMFPGFYGAGGVIEAYIGPLDLVSGAAAAYSTRKLRDAYSGSAIRVRRSSDNAEADIGFSNNELDTAALLAHCGAGSGFVVTWYDQSGNTRDVTQSNTALQPRVVNTGVIDTFNSKPTVIANGTTQYLQGNFGVMQPAAGATSLLAISGAAGQSDTYMSENNSASANTLYDFRASATNANTPAAIMRNDANAVYLAPTTTGTEVFQDGTLHLVGHVDTTTNITYLVDGAQSFNSAYSRSGTSTINRFTLFASGRPTVQAFFEGALSEVICYASALATLDRQALEADLKAYFGTP